MHRIRWTTAAAAAALILPMSVAIFSQPAQGSADHPKLRSANQRLAISAPPARSAATARAATADPNPLKLTQTCDPATILVRQSTVCTVTAENTGPAAITVDTATVSSVNLPMTAASGATPVPPFLAYTPRVTLQGTRPAGP